MFEEAGKPNNLMQKFYMFAYMEIFLRKRTSDQETTKT